MTATGAPADPFLGSLAGTGGVRLAWLARERPDPGAAVVFLCGHGESFYKYTELFDDLACTGASIYALDPRGQGSSQRLLPDREKGHVARWQHYVQDLRVFVREVVRPRCPAPLVGLGHSLGGAIIAAYLGQHPGDLAAAALSCPLLGLRLGRVARARRAGLALAGLVAGTAWVPGGGPFRVKRFEENTETHSRVRHERKFRDFDERPDLRMGEPTIRWANEAERMARSIRAAAHRIAVPLLVFQADEDVYVDAKALADFCARVPGCRHILLQGARHEILIEADPVRGRVVAELCAFIRRQAREGRRPPASG